MDGRYAAGVGASAGLLSDLKDFWKVHLFAREMNYPLGDRHNAWEAGLHQNFTLTTNTSLRAELTLSRFFSYNRTTGGLFWNLFF